MTEETKPIETTPAPETTPATNNPPPAPPQPPLNPPPEMDFSDLPLPAASTDPTPPPAQMPDVDAIVDKIVAKLNIPRKEAEELVEEAGYATKKDLAEMEERATQKAYDKMQERLVAEKYINQTVEQASRVERHYGEKFKTFLKAQGIEDPIYLDNAQLLYDRMRINKAVELGRPAEMPVLSAEETAELVQQHWKQFETTYLKGKTFSSPATSTTHSLGGGRDATTDTRAIETEADDYKTFQEKQKTGKVSQLDALKALTYLDRQDRVVKK